MAKEYQSTSYNCTPASGVMSLSTFHITVRQSALARKMRTKSPKGTVTVFDPWRPTGGTHTLRAAALTRALQPSGLYYIYD